MYKMQKRSQKAQGAGSLPQGMYGAFRTTPAIPPSMNPSWTAPVVAPMQPSTVTVAEPSQYRFASRAPVVRRSPMPPASSKRSATQHPKPNTAQYGQPARPSTNTMQGTTSYAHQQYSRDQRYYSDNQYDDFLATFQHRIDGMTGQRGGWGF